MAGQRALGAQPGSTEVAVDRDAGIFDAGASRTWILIGVGGMTFTVIFLQIVLFQMLTIFGDYITATTAISIRHSGRASAGTVTRVDAAR